MSFDAFADFYVNSSQASAGDYSVQPRTIGGAATGPAITTGLTASFAWRGVVPDNAATVELASVSLGVINEQPVHAGRPQTATQAALDKASIEAAFTATPGAVWTYLLSGISAGTRLTEAANGAFTADDRELLDDLVTHGALTPEQFDELKAALVVLPLTPTELSAEFQTPTGSELPLTMYRREQKTFAFSITDGSGQPINMTGWSFRFLVRTKNNTIAFQIDWPTNITLGGPHHNQLSVTITTANSARDAAIYAYELWAISEDRMLVSGSFRLLAALKGTP